ncbi:MAG: sigma-70 family RNA polymerase sigma factor [Chitinophagales bacterium]
MSETKTLDPSNWSEKYTNQLFAFAYTRTKNQALSEDLVQDTFFSALKAKENFKGKSTEKTWLYSILKNKIIDYYRKSSTKKEKNILDDEDKSSDAIFAQNGHWKNSDGFVTSKNEASLLIENKEFYEILDKCLANLPLKTERAFRMKHIEGLETQEVCKELEISASNYWVLLHRARLSLRDCLSKNKIK